MLKGVQESPIHDHRGRKVGMARFMGMVHAGKEKIRIGPS